MAKSASSLYNRPRTTTTLPTRQMASRALHASDVAPARATLWHTKRRGLVSEVEHEFSECASSHRLTVHNPSKDNGPCTCVLIRPAERILVRAYNPLNQRLYTTLVNEQTMREQLTRQQRRNGGDPNTYVMRATRYERLPSDFCLIMNVGAFRRERFEPIRERHFAIKRSRAADKFAQYKADKHTEAKQKLTEARAVMGQMEYAAKVAQRRFEREHKALLYGQVHLQAMVKAAEDALYFSRHQLAMYADLSKSSLQNSWDPLENANDHVWLKRKYEARKKLVLQVAIRDVAYRASFRADLAATAARIALEAAIKEESKAETEARDAESVAKRIRDELKLVRSAAHEVLKRIASMLTLRTTDCGLRSTQRKLVFNEPMWDIRAPSFRVLPVATSGWNLKFKQAICIVSKKFLGVKQRRRTLTVTVREDPVADPIDFWGEGLPAEPHRSDEYPPYLGNLMIQAYDHSMQMPEILFVNQEDIRGVLSENGCSDLLSPIVEDVSTSEVCAKCGSRMIMRREFATPKVSVRRTVDILVTGIGAAADGGVPIRCPRCSSCKLPEVEARLLAEDRDGRMSCKVVPKSDLDVQYAAKVRANLSRESEAMIASRQPQSQFSNRCGYYNRWALVQRRKKAVVRCLVSMLRLSRFDGKVTLGSKVSLSFLRLRKQLQNVSS